MTDLTFFTNEQGQTLADRFNKIIKNNTQFFDVLVGYFRASGFYEFSISSFIEFLVNVLISFGVK